MDYNEKHGPPWGTLTAHITLEFAGILPKGQIMGRSKIQQISAEKLREVTCQHVPHGRFLTKECGKWIAVDNSTGEAWTEEFFQMRQAVRWLRSESGISDGVDR